MTGTSERDATPRLGAVAPLDPGDPRRVGRYLLSGRLGAGGMGTVYLARAEDGGPPVAVKAVHRELAADPAFRGRFADEVAAARRVAPFCTARVLDADPAATPPYLVTEFVDGVPLGTAVAEGGPLDESTLHGVALGVAAALAAVHAAGVVHRDLKPANVLLSLSGPRVIDFGIARALDAAQQHTQAGMLIGTPGWMAPEQFRGEPVGPASDVFSWGSLVAYAATGRNPWQSDGTSSPGLSLPPTAVAHRILHGTPDLTGLGGPLRGLVEAALDKDPARRPTARALVDELLGDRPGRAADPTVAASRFVERTWTGLPTLAVPPPGNGHPGPGGTPVAGTPPWAGHAPVGPGQASRPGQAPPGPGRAPARPGQAPAVPGVPPPRSGWPAAPAPPTPTRAGPPQPPWSGAPTAGPAPTRALPPQAPRTTGTPGPAPTRALPPQPGWEGTRTTAPDAKPLSRRERLRRERAARQAVRTARPPAPPPADPYDRQPSRRRRRWYRRKRVLVPLLLLLLVVLAPRESRPTTPPGDTPTGSDVGRPVRDGQLEFVVQSWRCGVRQLGEGALARRPKGQFCLADVRVRNIGTQGRTLVEPAQKLRDAAGGEHSADFPARFYFTGQTLWENVGPGSAVRGTMAFDVPADARPTELELHDSPFSGGVLVRI